MYIKNISLYKKIGLLTDTFFLFFVSTHRLFEMMELTISKILEIR